MEYMTFSFACEAQLGYITMLDLVFITPWLFHQNSKICT